VLNGDRGGEPISVGRGRHPGPWGRAGVFFAKKIGLRYRDPEGLPHSETGAGLSSLADDYDVLTDGEVVGRIFKADLSMDACWTSGTTNTAGRQNRRAFP
jgi:hypothetical protein